MPRRNDPRAQVQPVIPPRQFAAPVGCGLRPSQHPIVQQHASVVPLLDTDDLQRHGC